MNRTSRILALCLLAASGTSCAHAAEEHPNSTLVVVGTGVLEIMPDRAVIQAGVETTGATSLEALEANSVVMSRVHIVLSAFNIPQDKIGTSQLYVRAVNERGEDGNLTNVVLEYEAGNSISVNLDDLSLVPHILPALTEAGANNIQSVRFEIRELAVRRNEARQLAIRNAIDQAEEIADTAGISLGRILGLHPGISPQRIVVTGAIGVPVTSVAQESFLFSVPIAPEKQTVTEHVTITYRIQ